MILEVEKLDFDIFLVKIVFLLFLNLCDYIVILELKRKWLRNE